MHEVARMLCYRVQFAVHQKVHQIGIETFQVKIHYPIDHVVFDSVLAREKSINGCNG